MILVDTSVWIDHLRGEASWLARLLEGQQVLTHPFVIGELALGRIAHRRSTLVDLANLPAAVVAEEAEALALIENEALAGSGLGYVDVHLLAATRLTVGASLWSTDKRLSGIAARLGVRFEPSTQA